MFASLTNEQGQVNHVRLEAAISRR